MSTWNRPTLKRHLDSLAPVQRFRAAAQFRVDEQPEAPSENPSAKCEVCGRTTSADMLTDTSVLPTEMRARLALTSEQRFACDACTERWYRDAVVLESELVQALGAPTEVLLRVAKRERPWLVRKGLPIPKLTGIPEVLP